MGRRFQSWCPGCDCGSGGGGPANACVTVKNPCTGATMPGQPVDIKQGGVIVSSGTTDATGVYCFVGAPSTSYTATITPTDARYATTTSAPFTTSATGGASATVTPTLSAGHICCDGCSDAITGDLLFTCGAGSVVIPGTTGGDGCLMVPSGSCSDPSGNCPLVSGQTAVFIGYACDHTAPGGVRVNFSWKEAGCTDAFGTFHPGYPQNSCADPGGLWAEGTISGTITGGSICAGSISISGTVPGTLGGNMPCPYVGGFTLTN